MSYLHNLRSQMEKFIESEQYKEAVEFAAEECRQSYYRGLEDGKTSKRRYPAKQKTRRT